jgi:hypothetical protein
MTDFRCSTCGEVKDLSEKDPWEELEPLCVTCAMDLDESANCDCDCGCSGEWDDDDASGPDTP